MTSSAPAAATGHLPELEALRGIAITLVFCHHAIGMVEGAWAMTLGGMEVSLPRAFLVAGGTGVSLFFVLSAFLLALPFLVEAEGGKRVNRTRFYERRALRILPLYWAAVLTVTVVKASAPSDMMRALPFLFFFSGYAVDDLSPYSGVWWSLVTEVQFYLVLPLLGLLRNRAARRLGAAIVAAYFGLYFGFIRGDIFTTTGPTHALVSHSLFGMAPIFGWGILAAWIYRRFGTQLQAIAAASSWARSGGADFLLLAILAVLGSLLQMTVTKGLGMVELGTGHAWHLLEGFLWAAVVLTVLLAPLRTKSWISNRVSRRIGELSYSIYLLHVPMLMLGYGYARQAEMMPAQGWTGTGFAVTAIIAAACVATATATYAFIERPFPCPQGATRCLGGMRC